MWPTTSSVLFTAMAYLSSMLVVSVQQAKTSTIIGVHTSWYTWNPRMQLSTFASIFISDSCNLKWSFFNLLNRRFTQIANVLLRIILKEGVIESRMFSHEQRLRSRFAKNFFHEWFLIYGIDHISYIDHITLRGLLPILLGLWHHSTLFWDNKHFCHYELLTYHHNHPVCIPFVRLFPKHKYFQMN